MIINSDMTVVKVFNNNIVLVKDNGNEKILFEKGIGFGKKFGEKIIKGQSVEKIFSIDDEQNKENFKNLIDRVDNDFVAVCQEIIFNIEKSLGEELNENIHIGLTDHLSFAIERLKKNEEIVNPFLVEIETLYSREFELATVAAIKMKEFTGVEIPDGEIGFIALHIHSARSFGKLSNTLKYSYLSNTIVEHIEDSLGLEIDRRSLDYARFLTHIRFAIERILNGNRIKNDLVEEIKLKYKDSYKVARETAQILANELGKVITADEVAYLAMHIQRFKVSIEIKS